MGKCKSINTNILNAHAHEGLMSLAFDFLHDFHMIKITRQNARTGVLLNVIVQSPVKLHYFYTGKIL